MLEILPYIGTLWLLIEMYGVSGAAWAWGLRVLADALLLFWAAGTTTAFKHIRVSALPLIGAFTLAFRMPYDSVLYLCIALLLVPASIGLSVASIPPGLRNSLKLRGTSKNPSFCRMPSCNHLILPD